MDDQYEPDNRVLTQLFITVAGRQITESIVTVMHPHFRDTITFEPNNLVFATCTAHTLADYVLTCSINHIFLTVTEHFFWVYADSILTYFKLSIDEYITFREECVSYPFCKINWIKEGF